METEICLCHVRKWLYRGSPVDLTMEEMPLREMDPAGSTGRDLRISHQVILSFALIVFGTQHGQALTAQQGYAMYGKALAQLNEALSDPACYTRDEIYLAVVSLACLEFLARTGPGNLISHSVGLERLLELRGPATYCSQRLFHVLNCIALLVLAASFSTGRPSILARSDWKAVLRARCSDEELQEQDLHDMIADCTVLNAERDVVMANWQLDPASSVAERDGIERRALSLRSDLLAWRKRWESDPSNAYLETPPIFPALERLKLSEAQATDLPAPYEFLNDSAAIILMLHNIALIYVLRTLVSLPYADQSRKGGGRYQDTYRATERLAALEICGCIPYYLNADCRVQLGSSPILGWAVTAAWETFRGKETAEGGWMMELLDTERGADIAKLL